MSLLAYEELLELLEQGVVHYATEAAINSTSIDLTLGSKILYEKPRRTDYGAGARIIFLKNREPLETVEHLLDAHPFYLYPGQFILAQTEQVFYLPNNISGEYKLKSSMARIGLEHLNAGWCDAGWNGSVLTLELKNMTQDHVIVLEKGVGIGQMVFFKHAPVPDNKSYAARGRYNNDKQVHGIKE